MSAVCGTCGYPMVWSEDRLRLWCCVYGRHIAGPLSTLPAGGGATLLELVDGGLSQTPKAIRDRTAVRIRRAVS